VDKSKASFFTTKKHLLSQTHKFDEQGNLILTYNVTQELEVEELIKKWIPYINVISPKSLKDKIEKELTDYLKKN